MVKDKPMTTSLKPFTSQIESFRAIPKIIDELDIQITKHKSFSEMTREDIQKIVDSMPAEYLHVIKHGRKSGPLPGSLFYDKWQEKKKSELQTK